MSRPQRIDQLLAQQAHRGRAQDHHALLMQPDDALIGTKIEEFRQLQPLELRVRQLSHEPRFYGEMLRQCQIGHTTSSHQLSVRCAMTRSTL